MHFWNTDPPRYNNTLILSKNVQLTSNGKPINIATTSIV